VLFGQLAKNVVAANFASRIGRNQSASLDPQNFHWRELPADSFVSRMGLDAARLLEIDQVDDDMGGAKALLEKFAIKAARADNNYFRVAYYFLQICFQQRTDVGDDLLDVLAI